MQVSLPDASDRPPQQRCSDAGKGTDHLFANAIRLRPCPHWLAAMELSNESSKEGKQH
jgi:hypothetical protein